MLTIVEFTVKTPKLPSHRHNPVLLLDNTRILLHQLGCCVVVYSSTILVALGRTHVCCALSYSLSFSYILTYNRVGTVSPSWLGPPVPPPPSASPHLTSKLHYNCQRRESFGTPKILIPSWLRSDQFMDTTHKQHLGVKSFFFNLLEKSSFIVVPAIYY